jgi:hypothetical protein
MRVLMALFVLILAGPLVVTLASERIGAAGKPVVATMQATEVRNSQPGMGTDSIVDRDDDPVELLPCTDEPNDCSLHSAIVLANRDGAPTTITFADHYRITLLQPLPSLTEAQTIIRARPGQEVHVNGNGTAGSIFHITGAHVTIEGLRLYGAGAGQPTIMISGTANNITVANNVIGDDDAPSGGCGQSSSSSRGIYIDAVAEPAVVRAWIYGNIIECLGGSPGEGITVATTQVIMGQNSQGQAGPEQRNVIRWNQGHGINLGHHAGNTIRNSLIHDNVAGGLFVTNFNNNIMDNEIR